MKRILGLTLSLGLAFAGFSQSKIAFINGTEILKNDLKIADTSLQTYAKDLQDSYSYLRKDYDDKVKKLKDSVENKLNEVTKTMLRKDINDLANRINGFQSDADAQLQKKRTDLLTPLYKKLNEAVKVVAAEGKYDFIIDVSITPLAFTNEKDDISTLVKRKLKP